MTVLHLGVVDWPYAYQGAEAVTTGDVAGWLEDKYGVMQFFFDEHKQEIADNLAESARGALESFLMGAPKSRHPLIQGTDKIEWMFQKFIDNKEMDGRVEGVPTQASLEGISHRFKDAGNKKGGRNPRPSFQDTTMYEDSFTVWVDNDSRE